MTKKSNKAVSYNARKYSGGIWCGDGEGFESMEAVMEWADDGCCDYVNVSKYREDGTIQGMKIHFEPTDPYEYELSEDY